jgi:hypothetical protein
VTSAVRTGRSEGMRNGYRSERFRATDGTTTTTRPDPLPAVRRHALVGNQRQRHGVRRHEDARPETWGSLPPRCRSAHSRLGAAQSDTSRVLTACFGAGLSPTVTTFQSRMVHVPYQADPVAANVQNSLVRTNPQTPQGPGVPLFNRRNLLRNKPRPGAYWRCWPQPETARSVLPGSDLSVRTSDPDEVRLSGSAVRS